MRTTLFVAGLLIVLTGSVNAYTFNGTPTSAYCFCSASGTGSCASSNPLITLGRGKAFALTDVTIANAGGNPANVTLEDGTGGSTKAGYFVAAENSTDNTKPGSVPGPVTYGQSYQTPIFFTTNVTAVCGNGANGNTEVTISGLVGPAPPSP